MSRRRKAPKRPLRSGHRMLQKWIAREGHETQIEAAAALGVTQQSLSFWLAGGVPTLEAALDLEARAGVPVSAWRSDESGPTLADNAEPNSKAG